MRSVRILSSIVGIFIAAIYLLNPTAGVFELLPDALPVVGNLDEAAMTALLLQCLRSLGRARTEQAPGELGPPLIEG
ncbi:MAG: DUF1232 domain-containing protein [Myxococcota bacterium]